MYKTLLRTLSAFSIVTITASAGFAQNTGAQNTPAPVDCENSNNQNLPECKVDFSDWTDSFARPRHAEPETLTPHNEFLRGYSTWLGSQGTAKVTNWMYSGFNDAHFNLNTRATGGMAAYKATHTNGAIHYYVGILSGTNLGAPVSETSGTATWHGKFQAISGDTTISPRDIALNIDFGAARSIDAFLSAVHGTNPFKITGTFNGQGVITGRVTHNASLAQDRNAQGNGGHLTGLIGQLGAVGAFVADARGYYSGGFTVDPTARRTISIADWASSYGNNLSTDAFNPNLTNRENQFLQGYHWGLSSRGVPVTNSNWMYVSSDADFDDGVAAYRGRHANGAIHYYAGILGNTDLGAPLTQTSGSAAWSGRFQMIGLDLTLTARDFVLNVTFSGAGTGSIDAFLPALGTTDPFLIAGTFDENGVITGTVDHSYWLRYGSSAEGSGATLTGLIGREGAVGAFVGYPGAIYAGGFFARPPLPTTSNVEYADWVNSFGDTPLPAVPDVVNPQSQFLQGTADGINNGNVEVSTVNNYAGGPNSGDLNLNTATFDGVRLGGDATDGVAYFHGANGKDYAGIFSGTDLGAPVTETEGTAKFYGKIGTSYYRRDFTLDIAFNAESTDGSVGTVRAFLRGSNNTLLEGTFDDNGVISGTVKVGRSLNDVQTLSDIIYTSVLTGLIGSEGAVGVFVDKVSSSGFSHGGFVAVPKVIPFDPNVKLSDWVRSFDNTPHLFGYILDDPEQARFLPGTDTSLYTYDLWNAVPQTLTLADGDLGGERADGVAYMSGNQSNSNSIESHHYAGILYGTNLGAPLDAPVTAAWSGKLGMIVDSRNLPLRDITLNINFARKGIEIADTKTTDNTHFVTFNNLSWDDNGVISGTMLYNSGAALSPHNFFNSAGIVTGLIGQQGAVAAFRSNQDHVIPYAGGFVARPPSE